MTKQEALDLVLKEVLSQTPDCSVLEEETETHPDCYVFYYQSNKYISTTKFKDMYVGHGPVIVCRNTKTIFETGSSKSPLEYVNNFSACGDPHAELTDILEIFEWKEGANKIEAIKLVKNYGAFGLAEAKGLIDKTLEGHSVSFTVSDISEAADIVAALTSTGFQTRQLWSNQV